MDQPRVLDDQKMSTNQSKEVIKDWEEATLVLWKRVEMSPYLFFLGSLFWLFSLAMIIVFVLAGSANGKCLAYATGTCTLSGTYTLVTRGALVADTLLSALDIFPWSFWKEEPDNPQDDLLPVLFVYQGSVNGSDLCTNTVAACLRVNQNGSFIPSEIPVPCVPRPTCDNRSILFFSAPQRLPPQPKNGTYPCSFSRNVPPRPYVDPFVSGWTLEDLAWISEAVPPMGYTTYACSVVKPLFIGASLLAFLALVILVGALVPQCLRNVPHVGWWPPKAWLFGLMRVTVLADKFANFFDVSLGLTISIFIVVQQDDFRTGPLLLLFLVLIINASAQLSPKEWGGDEAYKKLSTNNKRTFWKKRATLLCACILFELTQFLLADFALGCEAGFDTPAPCKRNQSLNPSFVPLFVLTLAMVEATLRMIAYLVFFLGIVVLLSCGEQNAAQQKIHMRIKHVFSYDGWPWY